MTLPGRTGRLSAGKIASELDYKVFLFHSLSLTVPYDLLTVCNQRAHSCGVRTAARLVFCWYMVLNLQCQWDDFFSLPLRLLCGLGIDYLFQVGGQQDLHIDNRFEGDTPGSGIVGALSSKQKV